MQKTIVRDFNISETDQLYELSQSTIELSYQGIYPDLAIAFFKKYHSKTRILERNENGTVVVAVKNNTIVATGSLVNDEISGVFVHPLKQRLGLGKTIMAELEKRAKKAGVTEVKLHMSLPSKEFYATLKYESASEQHIDVGSGQFLKYYEGKKKLVA
jgi:GNAT superfamily N-acetyltransferase